MVLGLIGVGKWGKNILRTLETITNDVELKYLCAQSLSSLGEYSARYETYSDWHLLLGKKDLTAVLIATPASTHFEIASAFIKQGISVFVEKPMVTSVAEAEKLEALVTDKNTVCMVGYEYMWNSGVHYLKKEIDQGVFGKILEIKSEHIQSPSRPDTDIFWDAGPHPLSIFHYLFGAKELVSSEGYIKHDSAEIKVIFKNGPNLNITASCSGTEKIRKFTVVGEKATAILDETSEKKLSVMVDGKTAYPKIDSNAPLTSELEHFIDCIKNQSTPITDVHFGRQITLWLEKISKNLK